MELGPLLSGEIQVGKVKLVEPVVHLEVLADGRKNSEFARRDDGSETAAPGSAPGDGRGLPLAVRLERVEIENSVVVYREVADGTAARRLGAEAIDAQRETVRAPAGELFDEQEAQERANRIREEGRRIIEETLTPAERYEATIARLNELVQAGALSQDTLHRAVQQAEQSYSGAADTARDLQAAGPRRRRRPHHRLRS